MNTLPGHTLLPMYPEQSPFDPPLPNIFPEKGTVLVNPGNDHETGLDGTDANSSLKIRPKPRVSNPFQLFHRRLENQPPPLLPHDLPPPLPELTILDLHFFEKLNSLGRYPVYKVSANIEGVEGSQSKTYALKVFPDLDPDEQLRDYRGDEVSGLHWSMFRFRKEKEAYAHLIHAGLSERGIVLHCYGYFTLSRSHVEEFSVLPLSEDDYEYEVREDNRRFLESGGSDAHRVQTRLDDRRPPKALLFDYIADIEPLARHNITDKVVKSVLMNLYEIHRSNVCHCDVAARNIMVLPGERVMWFDFDHANSTTDTSRLAEVTRVDMFTDLAFAWDLCYSLLNPLHSQ